MESRCQAVTLGTYFPLFTTSEQSLLIKYIWPSGAIHSHRSVWDPVTSSSERKATTFSSFKKIAGYLYRDTDRSGSVDIFCQHDAVELRWRRIFNHLLGCT
jgi:hypothetical protein